MCIKSISDEASYQITQLSESVNEFNEKVSYYKQRDSQMQIEYNEIKIQYQMLLKNVEDAGSQGMKSFDGVNNTSTNDNARKITLNTVDIIVNNIDFY
jgi:hypothetical protein